jgi:hypothetical protein
VDDQPEIGPVLRLAVFPNPIAEPVLESAGRDPGVDRKLSAEGKLVRLR